MPSKKTLVLVVDDDVRMSRMMRHILELEGYRVITVSNGEAAIAVFDEEEPQLVLLDIMMPGTDGCTTCQYIREFSQVPIIMVTAKSNEEEKVEALDAGADDYVTKPFSAKELAARVRAVLRRFTLGGMNLEPTFRCHDLTIKFTQHKVILGSQEVKLTATEYRLLAYLARNAGRVVTPDQILESVWGENYVGEPQLLQVNIARLRQKLKDNARRPKYIFTSHGIGYSMTKQT